MKIKSLNFSNIPKIPAIIAGVAAIIISVVLISFFTGEKTVAVETIASDNPESVISPVESGQPQKVNESIALEKISLNNAISIEKAFYGWQNLFDIFAYNSNDSAGIINDSLARNRTLAMIISNPNRKFTKGNSDKILEEYGNVIMEECDYYKLDWRLILAMIRQESAFTSDAVSHAGAYGFMQIMPRTGSMLEQQLQIDDHRSPVNNLRAGIYYYATLVGRYNDAGDSNKYRFALAAYNAGAGRVEDAMSFAYYYNENYFDWDIVKEYMKLLAPGNDSLHQVVWGGRPPRGTFPNWKEPYHYVENIMWYWQQYKKLYPLPQDNKNSGNTKKKKKK